MANTKQFGVGYPAATTPLTGAETLSVVQGGVTKDCTAQDIADLGGGSGGTPGGSNTQVQFNNAGAFGGDAGLVYDAATDTLTAVNVTSTGLSLTKASATGGAGLRLPHGAAPSSPTNGDVWTTTAGIFARVNGVTVGPLAAAGGSGAFTLIPTTSNVVRSLTTTPADDPELTVALLASSVYYVRVRAFITQSNANPDLKVTYAYTGTTTAVNGSRNLIAPLSSQSGATETAFLVNGAFTATNAGNFSIDTEYIIETNTAGQFTFQWAQNTSDAATLTRIKGSFLQYAKLI